MITQNKETPNITRQPHTLQTSNFINKLRLHLHDKNSHKNTELLMRGLISNAIKEQNFRRMQKIDYTKSIEQLFIDEIKKPISYLSELLPTTNNANTLQTIPQNTPLTSKQRKRLSLIINQSQPEKRNLEVSKLYITLHYVILDDYIRFTKL